MRKKHISKENFITFIIILLASITVTLVYYAFFEFIPSTISTDVNPLAGTSPVIGSVFFILLIIEYLRVDR